MNASIGFVALALFSTGASANCFYNGSSYSEGAKICWGGTINVCRDGNWVNVWTSCKGGTVEASGAEKTTHPDSPRTEDAAFAAKFKAAQERAKELKIDPEVSAPDAMPAAAAGAAASKWTCRVSWDFGYSDQSYTGQGPTKPAAINNARQNCRRENIIGDFSRYCSTTPQFEDCREQ